MEIGLDTFRSQIKEDIQSYQNDFMIYDQKLSSVNYAFNYWILCEIFHLDQSLASECIVEYNDGGLDCFVHFEETKELFLIQNKFYDKNIPIKRTEVSDFLVNPISRLKNGEYSRSAKLQGIFSEIKNDTDYRISLIFITTSEINLSEQTMALFNQFNRETQQDIDCLLLSEFCSFSSLYEKYYGIAYERIQELVFDLHTFQGKGYAAVRNDYKLPLPYEAFYIITPIIEMYRLSTMADKKKYKLYDQNIREFLGENPINNEIIRTLKSADTRKFFLYYNNGVTINCKKLEIEKLDGTNSRTMILTNPKIVNGCQTVNSISLAVNAVPDSERVKAFESAYVLVKVLIIDDQNENDKVFYKNVVKYTNRQNSVPDKSFVLAGKREFERIQQGMRNKGILVCVLASDKASNKKLLTYEKIDLIEKAKKSAKTFPSVFLKFPDIMIEIEKMLQILVAFFDSPQTAIQKKSFLLKDKSTLYREYSSKAHDFFTYDNWVNLIAIYKQTILENKQSSSPISPFYFVGFLGYVIRTNLGSSVNLPNIQKVLTKIFETEQSTVEATKYIKKLCLLYSKRYYEQNKCDYNTLIKSSIDYGMLKSEYDGLNIVTDDVVKSIFVLD